MKTFKLILKIFFIMCVIFLFIILFKKPLLDRNWTDDAQILPDVTITDEQVKIKNLRDWRYRHGETISRDYYEETFYLEKIEKAYFVFNPFGKWEGVGHGFFLFEFSDNKTVSVSVEARRENGEPFGAIRGLFNNFELWYAWGSAADMFSRRAVFHNEDLYLYPLLIKPETARGIFLDLAKTTESLETKPEFYNTVFSNCTNVLADASNRVNPGSIPWNWARVFTGYADNKLYDLGLISNEKSFEETFEEARIDELIRKILSENELISEQEFWEDLIFIKNLSGLSL